MNQRSKATLYHKRGVATQPLLRSRRPQELRVHEAVGGRQRSFEGSGLAHQGDHLLQSLELDLPAARKNAPLGPEKEIEGSSGDEVGHGSGGDDDLDDAVAVGRIANEAE